MGKNTGDNRLEGFYYNISNLDEQKEHIFKGISLLARHGDLEIMSQPIMAGAAFWLLPAGDKNTIEFCFVHIGEL
jgi:hypothetical protein